MCFPFAPFRSGTASALWLERAPVDRAVNLDVEIRTDPRAEGGPNRRTTGGSNIINCADQLLLRKEASNDGH